MPHIRQVPRKGAPRWEVVWYDPQGKKWSKTLPSEAAAEAFIAATPHRRGRGVAKGPINEPLDQRIRRLSKVDVSGCWIWQGSLMNSGYGQIGVQVGAGKRRTVGAHRVSYEAFVGPIPEGLVIDHLCRVRDCVNPDHLDVVQQRENIARSPIAMGAINAAKTHCPQGHPYSAENTYVWHHTTRSTTERICKTCRRDYSRRHKQRKREAAGQAVAS